MGLALRAFRKLLYYRHTDIPEIIYHTTSRMVN